MTTTNTAADSNTSPDTLTMKSIRFGIEVETIHLSREKAAQAIQTVVGGTVRYAGGGYDTWECIAADGRVWKAMSDASLSDRHRNAEVVSPILHYTDIEDTHPPGRGAL